MVISGSLPVKLPIKISEGVLGDSFLIRWSKRRKSVIDKLIYNNQKKFLSAGWSSDYKNSPMASGKIDSSTFVNETVVANIEIYFQVTKWTPC